MGTLQIPALYQRERSRPFQLRRVPAEQKHQPTEMVYAPKVNRRLKRDAKTSSSSSIGRSCGRTATRNGVSAWAESLQRLKRHTEEDTGLKVRETKRIFSKKCLLRSLKRWQIQKTLFHLRQRFDYIWETNGYLPSSIKIKDNRDKNKKGDDIRRNNVA